MRGILFLWTEIILFLLFAYPVVTPADIQDVIVEPREQQVLIDADVANKKNRE